MGSDVGHQGSKNMIGAIAGDVVGSIYEARPIKTTDFPLFHPRCHPTDDTVPWPTWQAGAISWAPGR